MAAALVDLHVVERLIGERFDTVSTSDTAKLGPGENTPSDPTTPFTQYLGCDFDTVLRSTADGEAQSTNVTAEFLCAAPVSVTRSDASQVMSAASAVLAAVAEFSASSSNHELTIREATVRRIALENFPRLRCVLITVRGTAQRTSGTSLE